MSTKSRLDKLYKECARIRLSPDVKLLFVSDLHMNDGDPPDDFRKNDPLFCKVMAEYFERKFTVVLLGDVYDLWEQPDEQAIINAHPAAISILQRFKDVWRLIRIKGNHDKVLDYLEAVVLLIGDTEIFCTHGNQGDFFSDKAGWLGLWFVRYFWTPLQWLGVHNLRESKRRKHEKQELELNEWAMNQSFISVFGHTHFLADSGNYKNSGSWVQMGGQGIEYVDGKFTDKHF